MSLLQSEDSRDVAVFNVLAWFASFLLALSPTFWVHAEVTEVYSLNAFFLTFLYWLSVRLYMGIISGKNFFLIAFLFGLGLGNHHTLLLMLPSLIILLWSKGKCLLFKKNIDGSEKIINNIFWRNIFFSLFLFILGLSIYLYIPVRSVQNPSLNWGLPYSFGNFMDVITRKGYETQVYSRSWELFSDQIKSFDLFFEFGIVGVLLIISGFYFLWKADKRVALSMLAGIFSFSILIILLVGNFKGNPEILMPFYIPALIFCSLVIGVGLIYFYIMLKALLGPKLTRLVFYSFIAGLSIISYSKNLSFANKSESYLAYDYGYNEMNSFTENAVYLPKVDSNTFVLWYLQKVEKFREDIDIIPIYFLTQRWYLPLAMSHIEKSAFFRGKTESEKTLNMIRSIFNHYYGEKDVYTNYMDEKYVPPGIHTITNGITFKLSKMEEKAKETVWDFYRLRNVGEIASVSGYEDEVILENYASSYYNYGLELYIKGETDGAIGAFENALAIRPLNADTLNNLAMLYAEKNQKLAKAEEMALQAMQLYDEKGRKYYNIVDTLGWIYYKMGRYKDSLKVLEPGRPYLEGNPYYHYHLAMNLYMLGKKDAAADEFSKALVIGDQNIKKEVLSYLKKIRPTGSH